MTDAFPPSVVLLATALAAALLPARASRGAALLGVLLATSQAFLAWMPGAAEATISGHALVLGGAAPWQRPLVVALLAILVASRHERGRLGRVALLVLGAGLLGATGNPHMLSTFVWFSVATVGGALLVASAGGAAAEAASFRGSIPLLAGGLLFLLGGALRHARLHTWALWEGPSHPDLHGLLDAIGRVPAGFEPHQPGTWLVAAGLLLLAAGPLLHGWFLDWMKAAPAYGAAAILLFPLAAAGQLALAFGPHGLVWLPIVGGVLGCLALAYALLCDDLRHVMAYGALAAVGLMLATSGLAGTVAVPTAAALFGGLGLALVAFTIVVAQIEGETKTRSIAKLGGLLRTWRGPGMVAFFAALAVGGVFPFLAPSSSAGAAMARAIDGFAVFAPVVGLLPAGLLVCVGLKVFASSFLGPDRGLRPTSSPGWLGVAAAALPLVASIHEAIAADVPASGWNDAGGPWNMLVHATLLGGVALFVLLRRSFAAASLPTAPRDMDLVQHALGRAWMRFVSGPFLRTLERISRLGHEELPAAFWRAAKNPPGAGMLLFRRFGLASASLFGSSASIERARAALVRDRLHFETRSPATAWPIGNVVLYALLLFVVWLILESL